MAQPTHRRRRWPWILAATPVALVALISAAVFVYIHFIQSDPPPRLSFTTTASESTASTPSTGATVEAATAGTWTVTDGSQAGYRAKEILFGQSTEAVGRTSSVSGSLVLDGTIVSSAEIVVDLRTVKSDESRRDGQFQGRIMNTSQFPTATFKLTSPIQLEALPENLAETTVQATGELTLRGTTRTVTMDVTGRRNGSNIEVNATIPVTFSDYGIPEPSNQAATVEDSGEIEILVVFAPPS